MTIPAKTLDQKSLSSSFDVKPAAEAAPQEKQEVSHDLSDIARRIAAGARNNTPA